MKKIESHSTDSSRSDIEDAEVLPVRGFRSRRLRVAVAVATLVLAAAMGWTTNHFYLEPKRDDTIVAHGMPDWVGKLEGVDRRRFELHQSRLSEEDRLWENLEFIKGEAESTKTPNLALIYRSALRQAIRAGIPEAKLLYGVALRDGIFGPKDTAGALQMFDQVEREMADGLRAGDAVATYVNARMWLDGLGRTPDQAKAEELARRAAPNLNGWRLDEVTRHVVDGKAFFSGNSDLDLGKKLADRMLDQRLDEAPNYGSSTCRNSNPRHEDECRREWYERAVKVGIELAIPRYAQLLLETDGEFSEIGMWFKRGAVYSDAGQLFAQAFLTSILSTNDADFLKALAEMWVQTKAKDEYGLYRLSDSAGLLPFFHRVKDLNPQQTRNFLVGLAAFGILTDRSAGVINDLMDTSQNLELARRAISNEFQIPASIAIEAIRSGQSLDGVNLQRTEGAAPTAGSIGRNVTVKPADREQQGFTGYIKGEPKEALGGLSTFTVDNRQGDRDAVARIYLNGSKPAVRHIYIKKGETFKAQSIQAGTYIFRYRYIGSEDTFEADRPFELTQTKTDGGTRFSNVTVTLFKVKDGNMQTKKVDASSF